MDLDDFTAGLEGLTRQGGGYRARCPAHDDSSPSLMISEKDGKILVKCHGGCDTSEVLAAMGKSFSDLAGEQRLVAEYRYVTAEKEPVFTVLRFGPKKDFRMAPGMPPDSDKVVYHLPWVKHARDAGKPLWFVEGEKDADTLVRMQHPATTIPGGAKARWCPNYTTQLRGCHVRIVADDDEPGRAHALRVAKEISGSAAKVEMFLPARGMKDISEHLEAGYSLNGDLRPFVEEEEEGLGGKRLSEMKPAIIDWAWHPYLPLGSFIFIEGDPGVAKSTLTCDLAARFSSGTAMPDGSAPRFPGGVGVLMLSAEDDPEATILPRCLAAGANPVKVKVIGGLLADEQRPFELSTDGLDRLRTEIRHMEAKVVIIDPIVAFMPENTDTNSDHSVRRVLGQVARLAHDEKVLIIFVRHLNKAGAGKAIYRGGGSIGFTGAARGAYLIAKHPDDEEIRVFTTIKMNLAKEGQSLTYKVVENAMYGVGKIEWLGPVDMGAQDTLDGTGTGVPRQEYVDIMAHAVSDGPKTWKQVEAIAAEAGFSARSLERYRSKVLEKVIGHEGNRSVMWRLKAGIPTPASLSAATPQEPKASDQPFPPFTPLRSGEGGPDPEIANADKDIDMRKRYSETGGACDKCGTKPGVQVAEPHWLILCQAHYAEAML